MDEGEGEREREEKGERERERVPITWLITPTQSFRCGLLALLTGVFSFLIPGGVQLPIHRNQSKHILNHLSHCP